MVGCISIEIKTKFIYIAKKYTDSNILLLTYNSKLKIETREKVTKLEINNLEVHSYHSFGYKYYKIPCFLDSVLREIIDEQMLSKINFYYDIIILDEAQDIIPLYYEFICKIYSDNMKYGKICILGDKCQNIYDFMDSDERYIIYGNSVFNFNKKFEWKKFKLSQSFRVPYTIASFINKCMLGYERIISYKKNITNKPRYVVCDCYFSTRTFIEVVYYLNLGYKPNDIFILAPSLRKGGKKKSHINVLENQIKTKLKQIPVYVPMSDNEILDSKVLENKLVFSTFNQVKGLERKVVIIFNFDTSYFKFYEKDKDPNKCTNRLYVATTRSLERLTVFHHYKNDQLPFLNIKLLNKYCCVENYKNYKFPIKSQIEVKKIYNNPIAVTHFIKYLSENIIYKCMNFLKITKIRLKKNKIDIPIMSLQKYGYEIVSELTGTAIPMYFEHINTTNGSTSIQTELKKNKSWWKKIDNCSLNEKNEIQLIKNLLWISIIYGYYRSGFKFKLEQINNLDWMSFNHLKNCIERLKSLKISSQANYEILVKKDIKNVPLFGIMDCIDGNNIYEFKAVSHLSDIHHIQVAIYMFLNWNNNISHNYYLYNILTDELHLVECNYENLKKMMSIIITHKYEKKYLSSDDEFILTNKKRSNKFIIYT
jgi:hypothetical protein